MSGYFINLLMDRPLTVLELLIIVAVVALLVGVFVGIKISTFYRTNRVARLSKRVLDLEEEKAELKGKLRAIKFDDFKKSAAEVGENLSTNVRSGANTVGSAVKSGASTIFKKGKSIFNGVVGREEDDDEPQLLED